MALATGRFGPVPITMIRRSGDDTPDWQPELFSATFHFPGGNISETQITGRGVLRLECMVRLASSAVFEQFEALLGTRQTLRMPEMATAYRGDRTFQEFGDLSKEFDDVLLNAPFSDVRLRIGGAVDVSVTFERNPAVPS